MARTKTKPGPKPKYGEREEIHVQIPVDDLTYIRSVTHNVTGWVIQAIHEKRERDRPKQSESIEELLTNSLKEDGNAKMKLFNHYFKRLSLRLMELGCQHDPLQTAMALSSFNFALMKLQESAVSTDAIKEFEAYLDEGVDELWKAKQLQQENLTDHPINR